jgi:hypothetical protein
MLNSIKTATITVGNSTVNLPLWTAIKVAVKPTFEDDADRLNAFRQTVSSVITSPKMVKEEYVNAEGLVRHRMVEKVDENGDRVPNVWEEIKKHWDDDASIRFFTVCEEWYKEVEKGVGLLKALRKALSFCKKRFMLEREVGFTTCGDEYAIMREIGTLSCYNSMDEKAVLAIIEPVIGTIGEKWLQLTSEKKWVAVIGDSAEWRGTETFGRREKGSCWLDGCHDYMTGDGSINGNWFEQGNYALLLFKDEQNVHEQFGGKAPDFDNVEDSGVCRAWIGISTHGKAVIFNAYCKEGFTRVSMGEIFAKVCRSFGASEEDTAVSICRPYMDNGYLNNSREPMVGKADANTPMVYLGDFNKEEEPEDRNYCERYEEYTDEAIYRVNVGGGNTEYWCESACQDYATYCEYEGGYYADNRYSFVEVEGYGTVMSYNASEVGGYCEYNDEWYSNRRYSFVDVYVTEGSSDTQTWVKETAEEHAVYIEDGSQGCGWYANDIVDDVRISWDEVVKTDEGSVLYEEAIAVNADEGINRTELWSKEFYEQNTCTIGGRTQLNVRGILGAHKAGIAVRRKKATYPAKKAS